MLTRHVNMNEVDYEIMRHKTFMQVISEWSNLHLSEFQRVVIAFPGFPVDAVSERRMVASQVLAIQVGQMTSSIPPGTFVCHRTLVRPPVVVLVFGGKLIRNMM